MFRAVDDLDLPEVSLDRRLPRPAAARPGRDATRPRYPERAMAEALNVKRHQLRRALSALRANGEIAPAEAATKMRDDLQALTK